MINITLKDGIVKQYEPGIQVAEIARSLGAGLYKAACAARVDGVACDLRTELLRDCAVEICTFDDPDGRHAFWHTGSHILAQAVLRLHPAAKFAIGPAVADGFYYDFDISPAFTPEDLTAIEDEMRKIVKEALPIERILVSPADAMALFKDQPYKLELIQKHADAGEEISLYRQGEFTDLCAGPHLLTTAPLKAIKLTNATGAYWHGDSRLPMLSRIYGTAYPKASELEAHLALLEEAKKRDHRKLGRELGIFAMMDEGPGFPFFLPNGMAIKNNLLDYWRELHHRDGYKEISTPIMLNQSLWQRSGHWGHYKNNMYTTEIDDTAFAIKPMNCPGAMLVYKNSLHSYRELPLRMAELGLVHRHELSGALHGLMRVRSFTQDDAHIYMMESQIKEEIKGVIRLTDEIYSMFGFDYKIELSTMPEDHMGDEATWETATADLRAAMEELGRDYTVNEGDGAFYGPKLDFHLVDAIGRTWQCATIQLDFQMPERFELEYVGEDGERHRPVMIHRALLGSIERFIGILIEHFAGAFPTWLAPTQVMLVPISEAHHAYAHEVLAKLEAAGIRAEADLRNEKMNYKIREAQLKKIPYMLVMGDKEMADGTVAVRARKEERGGTKSVADFIAATTEEIVNRSL
ncbi:MAG: threonine--tRNA ligase [Ruminococcaceae bacterium]|nr:threonine--tRNA ligase [Oscillospiraceae bacterium]